MLKMMTDYQAFKSFFSQFFKLHLMYFSEFCIRKSKPLSRSTGRPCAWHVFTGFYAFPGLCI